MRVLDKARLRLRSLFRRSKVGSELHAEFRSHLDELIEENIAAGMSRDAAETAVRGAVRNEPVRSACVHCDYISLGGHRSLIRLAACVARPGPRRTKNKVCARRFTALDVNIMASRDYRILQLNSKRQGRVVPPSVSKRTQFQLEQAGWSVKPQLGPNQGVVAFSRSCIGSFH
jgi:hypothetical protein